MYAFPTNTSPGNRFESYNTTEPVSVLMVLTPIEADQLLNFDPKYVGELTDVLQQVAAGHRFVNMRGER